MNGSDVAGYLHRIPLLAKLGRVDIAKLAPDVSVIHLVGDEALPGKALSSVWLVVNGELEVLGENGQGLMVAGKGEVLGEMALANGTVVEWSARALMPSTVVRISKDRFGALLAENPAVAAEFHGAMLARGASLLKELSRTKAVLADYAVEIWRGVPMPDSISGTDLSGTSVAAALAGEAVPPRSGTVRKSRRLPNLGLLGSAGGVALGAIIALWPIITGAGLSPLYVALGLLVAAGINWLIGLIPDYVVALALPLTVIFLGLAKPAEALSGFIAPSWFLILAVWVIGVAVSKSGLLYRLALHMLSLLPPTFSGQAMALILAGIVVMPLLPNGQSRLGMVAPLIKELGELLRIKRGSKAMAGLALAALTSFGLLYFLVPNGSTVALLAWSLLPPVVQAQMTWPMWLLASLPLGLAIAGGAYWMICTRYRPEVPVRISHERIRLQLRILGPMSRTEWLTAGVLALTLFGFVFANRWKFDASWIAVAGMLVILGTGVVDKMALRRNVDWGFLIFFGAVMSFAAVFKLVGLESSLTGFVTQWLSGIRGNSYAFVTVVTLVTFLVRLFVPTYQCVPLLLITINPIATSLGFNPFVSSVLIVAMGANFLIPRQNLFYMVLHSGMDESFSHKHVAFFAAAHCVILVLAGLASVPLWKLMGLLP